MHVRRRELAAHRGQSALFLQHLDHRLRKAVLVAKVCHFSPAQQDTSEI